MGKGKNVLTTGEVARICNVAPRTVTKWFDSGQLRGYRIPGSRDRRIPVTELSRFMKQHHIPLSGMGTNTTRVLVVGTWSEQGEAWVSALRELGRYDVQAVTNSFQVGTTLARFAPHVILIEALGSELDALALCAAIRNDDESQGIRLVAVAEHVTDARVASILCHGFDDCVTTVDAQELVKCVEQVMAVIY